MGAGIHVHDFWYSREIETETVRQRHGERKREREAERDRQTIERLREREIEGERDKRLDSPLALQNQQMHWGTLGVAPSRTHPPLSRISPSYSSALIRAKVYLE